MSEHRARKRFGQNFLHDQRIIERIIKAIAPKSGERLVEIGPGLGALTEPLLEAVEHLDAVELDRDLVERLQRFAPKLTVHSGDALKFDFRRLATEQPIRVVGNLPYNISTPIIFHLLEQLDVIIDMHFMLQKEVVERLAAEPGNKDYGRLTVMVQQRCEVDKLFTVPPGAFNPPPKVDSAIVRLVPHTSSPYPVPDQALFAKLVAQAFSQRRKTLRNTLKGLLDAADIEANDIDPGRRPETLSVAEFAALATCASSKTTH